MTPNSCLSKEDTNDDDFFYEIPSLVIHEDDNACERLKKILQEPSERDGPDHRLNKCDLNYFIAVKRV